MSPGDAVGVSCVPDSVDVESVVSDDLAHLGAC